MCHGNDSRPPAPPVVGEVAEQGRLTLTSADGTRFGAYAARPANPGRAGVVVMPDVRGLHPYYEQLAVRFAEAGLDAVAFDYFGRTAGVGERGEGFDWKPHREQVRPEHFDADVAAALAHLAGAANGPRPLFTVGFCWGGSQSWRLAAADLDLTGVIGFYGRPRLVADAVDRMRRPVLLLVAGADHATPVAESAAFDRRLTGAGVPHEMHVYAGAPHSFFDRSYADWADACADAWQRMLGFIDRHARGRASST
jgi:carboxymethylenebutenolidase